MRGQSRAGPPARGAGADDREPVKGPLHGRMNGCRHQPRAAVGGDRESGRVPCDQQEVVEPE
eukprot:686762-Lingulodinium_polyedra.AAC.1